MAEPQVNLKRTPSHVIQGKRHEIEAQLQQVDAEETLTLIIPGKKLEAGDVVPSIAQKSPAEMTFAEILAPLQQDFEATGMTEEELDAFIDAQVKQVRDELDAEGSASK